MALKPAPRTQEPESNREPVILFRGSVSGGDAISWISEVSTNEVQTGLAASTTLQVGGAVSGFSPSQLTLSKAGAYLVVEGNVTGSRVFGVKRARWHDYRELKGLHRVVTLVRGKASELLGERVQIRVPDACFVADDSGDSEPLLRIGVTILGGSRKEAASLRRSLSEELVESLSPDELSRVALSVSFAER